MIFTFLVIFRRNLRTHRVEFLCAPTPADLQHPVWVPALCDATPFQQSRAREVRKELAARVNRRRWRVTTWDSRNEMVTKPVLSDIDWRRMNTDIAAQYNVSESTVGNWRIRVGVVPARRGGVRTGAGRKAS